MEANNGQSHQQEKSTRIRIRQAAFMEQKPKAAMLYKVITNTRIAQIKQKKFHSSNNGARRLENFLSIMWLSLTSAEMSKAIAHATVALVAD
jgi:hypothetical protein